LIREGTGSGPLPASRRHLMAIGRLPVRKASMRWDFTRRAMGIESV